MAVDPNTINPGGGGVPSFLTGNQSSASFFQDPVGYALFHQSAPALPSPIQNLTEAELGYYQQNLAPLQQQLLRSVIDPNTLKQNVATAQSNVNQQFSQLPGAFQRQMSGLGVVSTPAQKAAFAKQAALGKGIATAAASNQAVQQTGAMQRAVLGV